MQTAEKSEGWSEQQIKHWLEAQTRRRSYLNDVLAPLHALPANLFHIECYGALSCDPERYPLFHVTAGDLHNGKPNILITGGVHGYEPSGVKASIRFLQENASCLAKEFNFVVYPCISPWAYEYDHRWNNLALDPNRQFVEQGTEFGICEEAEFFMTSIKHLGVNFSCAIDFHETPDRDIELRQQRAERFGTPLDPDFRIIPQGFYLMLSEPEPGQEKERMAFGRSIIREVQKTSPIAPENTVLGKKNLGGITVSKAGEGLMRSFLEAHADHVAVTEVYPDHTKMDPDTSVRAQLAAIDGALRFLQS